MSIGLPSGQCRTNSSNFPVTSDSWASADTPSQSSQCHHLSVSGFQGGNGMHDMYQQYWHRGAFPSIRTNVVANRAITDIIRPINLTTTFRIRCHGVALIPKKNIDNRSRVEIRQRKPYTIPPISNVDLHSWCGGVLRRKAKKYKIIKMDLLTDKIINKRS